MAVLLPALALATVVAQAPEPATTATTTQATPEIGEPEAFRAVRVEISGFDEAAVLAALRLRLAGLTVERHGGPPPTESPHAYVLLTRADTEAGRLRIVTSEGRAYDRPFVIPIGEEVRVAASTTVNLLFSIEQGAVKPDQEDVAIPESPAPTEPDPVPEPPPVIEPVQAQPATPPSTPAAKPPPPASPPWELGVGLQGAAVLGLPPQQYGAPLAGAGGGLSLELRSPRGAALALDLRGLGRADAALGVGRLRVGLAGGYAWRRGRFELPVLLAVTVEPWWTTTAGASAAIYREGTTAVRRPLIGAALRLTPALRIPLARGPLAGLRIGPRLELAGSLMIDDGPTLVGLADATGQPRARLGGLELSLGLDITLQFGLRTTRTR